MVRMCVGVFVLAINGWLLQHQIEDLRACARVCVNVHLVILYQRKGEAVGVCLCVDVHFPFSFFLLSLRLCAGDVDV